MMQETSYNKTNSEFGMMGRSQDVGNNYKFDTATMQFNKVDRLAGRNPQIEKVNLLIKNTRQSFTELGMEGSYVKGFDEDIILAIGMAPTKDSKESPSSVNYNSLAEEQGVDVSTMADGEYEDGSGVTVTIKAGKVVSVQ
jgi:hypothetical protein